MGNEVWFGLGGVAAGLLGSQLLKEKPLDSLLAIADFARKPAGSDIQAARELLFKAGIDNRSTPTALSGAEAIFVSHEDLRRAAEVLADSVANGVLKLV